MEAVIAFLGCKIGMGQKEWDLLDDHLVSRRILITKSGINGRSIRQLNLRNNFGVNITRVNRSGVDLIADSNLSLQVGDRVTVVGDEAAIHSVERVLGNQMKRLNEPNLIPIFIGIFLGVLLGSIPFAFPGIPQPVKLGLAGGPLIIAILISIFGPKYHLVTYTTMSANLMLREIGICLFLACVGIGAGENFVSTIVNGGGFNWIGIGVIITIVPLLIIGVIARLVFKINYYTLMGLLAGSTTDPPALAYSNATSGNDAPAVGYATVYPLTMFLRVLSAQLLILFFC
jgi:putative transport protein